MIPAQRFRSEGELPPAALKPLAVGAGFPKTAEDSPPRSQSSEQIFGRGRAMTTPPVCNRHPNLQMIPCSLTRAAGSSNGYRCPVPGCGRHCDEQGYFDVELRPRAEDDTMSCQTEPHARDASRAYVTEESHPRRGSRHPGALGMTYWKEET